MGAPPDEVVIAECKRIGAAGEAGELPFADCYFLVLMGMLGRVSDSSKAEFCHAVSSVCQVEANRSHFGELAIKTVISTMRARGQSVQVQSCGSRALWSLNYSKTNVQISVGAGALDCLLKAWNVVGGFRLPASYVIGALASLTTADSVQSIIAQNWHVGILAFMMLTLGDAQCQYACCFALSNLAGTERGRAALSVNNLVIHWLQSALATHTGHAGVQTFAKSALELLSVR